MATKSDVRGARLALLVADGEFLPSNCETRERG